MGCLYEKFDQYVGVFVLLEQQIRAQYGDEVLEQL